MKCVLAQELLSAYLDNELDPEQRQAIEQHLAECLACRQELESMRLIDESIKEEPVEEPSREFVFTLNRRIKEGISVRPGLKWFRFVPLLVPVAVAALVIIVMKNIEPMSDIVDIDHRVAYAEIKSEPDLDIKVPKLVPEREAASRSVSSGGYTTERRKEEAVPPAPALAPVEKKYSPGKASACETVVQAKDDEFDGLIADELTVEDIPEGRVVRAIVDTTGRIVRVVTGRNIVPEPDTFLENRLQGRQVIVPTVSGEKQQLYVDLTIQKDTCK